MAEKRKKEKVKIKQPELKGMPPKSEAEKEAELYVSSWEDWKTAESNYRTARKRMSDFADKNLGIHRITVVDSIGVKRTIKIDRQVTTVVKITKAKKGE